MMISVAGTLDDPPVVERDRRVDQVAAERPQARERPLLVGAGKPAVSDDVGDQDCRELAGLAHSAPLGVATLAQMPGPVCLFDGRTAQVRIPSVPFLTREGPLRVEGGRS